MQKGPLLASYEAMYISFCVHLLGFSGALNICWGALNICRGALNIGTIRQAGEVELSKTRLEICAIMDLTS